MRTLRIAFLSALVLELVATLSVALVAVPVGIRLLGGGITLCHRAAGAAAHPGGVPAAAGRRQPLPRQHGGAHRAGRGADPLRRARAAGPDRRATPAPDGRGEIRFEDVTVAYERTTALRDVTLTIRPGERIAIIGPSGAGKSTLLGLLLGFVTPTAGRVTVDGVDLADVDLDAWRRQLAWVPQRAHLFAGLAGRQHPPRRPGHHRRRPRHAAVTDAALDDVVAALPDGLATELGERGHGLSSGQRQRVALARAFLRDAPVVLLDEPTARLDTASEAVVLDATRRLVAGRTALLVAHRPALLDDADRILRVEDGRVTELTPEPTGRRRRDGMSADRPHRGGRRPPAGLAAAERAVLRLARPYLGRLVGAGLLAAATEFAGLALMATATWLLMSAAGRPPLDRLTVAIVAVRALAISRGVLRYTERLAGHDAVLRMITDVRARVFATLAARRDTAVAALRRRAEPTRLRRGGRAGPAAAGAGAGRGGRAGQRARRRRGGADLAARGRRARRRAAGRRGGAARAGHRAHPADRRPRWPRCAARSPSTRST